MGFDWFRQSRRDLMAKIDQHNAAILILLSKPYRNKQEMSQLQTLVRERDGWQDIIDKMDSSKN